MIASRSWLSLALLGTTFVVGDLVAQERPTLVRWGQSAAFTGPAGEIGKELRLGVEAAFFEANTKKTVPRVRFSFVYYDDGYEPERAIQNTRKLINEHKVFGLIGEVGTPTSRAVVPIATEEGVPFIAPFTGAEFLRMANQLPNVVNLRASYRQEVDEMVDRLFDEKGITRIGILYQNDSFGKSGYENTKLSLARYGIKLVASGTYERNTTAVKTAVFDLSLAKPEAVIIVGSYKPASTAIKWSQEIDFNPLFFNISFVGSQALQNELGQGDFNVYMTQVVPDFMSDKLQLAIDYRVALENVWPGAVPSFVSFEGYAAARMVVAAFGNCIKNIEPECILDRFRQLEPINISGLELIFGPDDNQGSDKVYLTVLNPQGEFVPALTLNEEFVR